MKERKQLALLCLSTILASLLLAGCQRSPSMFGLTLNEPLPPTCALGTTWTNHNGTVQIDIVPPRPENLFTQYCAFLDGPKVLALSAKSASQNTVPFLMKRFGKPAYNADNVLVWTNSAWNALLAPNGFIMSMGIKDTNISSDLFYSGSAEERLAQESKSCRTHLDMLGSSLRIWALEHGDKFPFQVPRGAGGSLEFCQPDAQGYDANPWRHFLAIQQEIGSPRYAVCSKNEWRVHDWKDLENSSACYRLRTARSVNENADQEILAACPKHRWVLRCNGSVDHAIPGL